MPSLYGIWEICMHGRQDMQLGEQVSRNSDLIGREGEGADEGSDIGRKGGEKEEVEEKRGT